MITELGDGVWQIPCGAGPSRWTRVNAYLVDDDGDLTLVDTGTPRDGGRIRAAIRETGHEVADLERILVTHYDIDHVGGLASLLESSGATCYVGAGDAGFLMGREKPPAFHHKGLFQRLLGPVTTQPNADPELVADEAEIGSFTAYHTPGHTPGHTAYVSEARNVAFVGDLVMENHGELSPSPWALSYDTEAVTESIHELAEREPAVEILAMGHGTPFVRAGAVRLAELGERIEE
jgi:glyoxylase-like metal-dependent hydrolase (beta-lactamase superfamily II)